MEYYLFVTQSANFPLLAIYLPISLLPNNIKNNFEKIYSIYGNIIYETKTEDQNIINYFELLADDSPSCFEILFNIDINIIDDENISFNLPIYYRESILYYDNHHNRKKFNIDNCKYKTSELYKILETKYNVVKSIFYKPIYKIMNN
jgi:hypothetical protein